MNRYFLYIFFSKKGAKGLILTSRPPARSAGGAGGTSRAIFKINHPLQAGGWSMRGGTGFIYY